MTRHRGGYALLSALVAVIVAVSAGIYAAADAGTARPDTFAAPPAPHNPAQPASTGVWATTWAAAPDGAEPGTETLGTAGRTVRNLVHTSVGGTGARVTLSNLYGTRPLTVTHATLAVAAADDSPAAAAGTLRRLTFGGVTTVVVAPGGQAVSDTVAVALPADSDVLVSVYTPTSAGPVTFHRHARQTGFTADGEHTEDVTGTAFTAAGTHWRYLTALDVLGPEADGTLVALGDSITDGITATEGADRRWPDILAERLRAAAATGADVPRYGVANEGISGNQVLADGRERGGPSGLSRLDRDVLGRTNVKVVVIDLGVNDILRNQRLADPDAIVTGLRALVERAHARGVRAVGTTLTPFGGHRGYSGAREAVRQQVNAAIRDGGVFDAVVDFDKALRDPYDPRSLRPEYDSGDRLHPSDLGYRKLAEAIDLTVLKGSATAAL
ncbi:SGNH/GDSL hydrolase family protein [Streptomyces antibioticus]|uniref:SGNH/GDSL hydrolase family protein n=1 Tax=Streptomyces antibioticus TaxID=1890 RepID=UPI00379DC353